MVKVPHVLGGAVAANQPLVDDVRADADADADADAAPPAQIAPAWFGTQSERPGIPLRPIHGIKFRLSVLRIQAARST